MGGMAGIDEDDDVPGQSEAKLKVVSESICRIKYTVIFCDKIYFLQSCVSATICMCSCLGGYSHLQEYLVVTKSKIQNFFVVISLTKLHTVACLLIIMSHIRLLGYSLLCNI